MGAPVRDPVCGMLVDPETSVSATHDGQAFFFCAEYCRDAFLQLPERYPGLEISGDDPAARRIAYFSMEVGIDPRLPIYSGGLGVLAADTLRSFADLRVPAVGVTLLFAQGYFDQLLDAEGNQTERPVAWSPGEMLRPLKPTVQISIAGRPVRVRAWRYDVLGQGDFVVPLILLDTGAPENAPADRALSNWLYGGDERYRLAQEVVLGIAGVRMLRALGYMGIERYHMNEGHASLLALELLREAPGGRTLAERIDIVRTRCVFTTHTPVAAGHDQFPYELVESVLGEPIPLGELRMLGGRDRFSMTLLALNLSHYINGVAKRHGQVSQRMFPGYTIDAVTNGVHSRTWTCEAFRRLYDRHIPGWGHDPFALRYAIRIPAEEVWVAHAEVKRTLLEEVRRRTGVGLSADALTIGFARRATAYKRADLVLSDPQRLVAIARAVGAVQLIFAGKAHPRDEPGKAIINKVFRMARELADDVRIVYVANYDLELAGLLTAGVDLWLNTPLPPQEASGTSGMKAAHNGVPSLSVLDGWWAEGHVEGITGWSIGPDPRDVRGPTEATAGEEAAELYGKLGGVIAPLYYHDRRAWIDIMRRTIAFNASFFNTHRMVQQYAANAYV